jgi:hypothetical protein
MVCNQSPGMIDRLLELGAARVARPVLRGGGGSDATSLPNHLAVVYDTGLVAHQARKVKTTTFRSVYHYGSRVKTG